MEPDEAERHDTKPAEAYTVGYRRPPVASRFKPGRSGNPHGRAKGARSLAAIVAAALGERVMVKENEQRRRITKLEAAVKQWVNRAAGGDVHVTRLLLALVQTLEAKAAPTEPEFVSKADAAVIADLARRLTERR